MKTTDEKRFPDLVAFAATLHGYPDEVVAAFAKAASARITSLLDRALAAEARVLGLAEALSHARFGYDVALEFMENCPETVGRHLDRMTAPDRASLGLAIYRAADAVARALLSPAVGVEGLSSASPQSDHSEPRGALPTKAGGELFRRDDEDPEAYAAMVRMAGRENDALLAADRIREAALLFLKERDEIVAVGHGLTYDVWRQRVETAVSRLRVACEEGHDAPS